VKLKILSLLRTHKSSKNFAHIKPAFFDLQELSHRLFFHQNLFWSKKSRFSTKHKMLQKTRYFLCETIFIRNWALTSSLFNLINNIEILLFIQQDQTIFSQANQIFEFIQLQCIYYFYIHMHKTPVNNETSAIFIKKYFFSEK
jgi:hypothetical protein